MLICLTGLPGSGKTTLIKKLVEYLKRNDVGVEGFFTEEIRDSQGYRVGFDIVTLKDERAVFARKRGIQSSYKVGPYFVDNAQFEKLVLPLLNNPGKIMIIDEIGKMELFSDHFKNCITNLVQNSDITIVATVPLKGNDRFIKDFKEKAMKIVNVGTMGSFRVAFLIKSIMRLIYEQKFQVERNNRNNLLEEIITFLDIK